MPSVKESELFKLQLPEYTSGPIRMLVYNVDRSFYEEMDVTDELIALFKQAKSTKIFLMGSFGKDGLELNPDLDIVRDPGW